MSQEGTTAGSKEQSIFFAILVPMLLLVMAEVVIVLGILGASGIVSRLNHNDCAIMDKQVESRKEYLQHAFLDMAEEVDLLAAEVNASTQRLIDEGELDMASVDANATNSSALMKQIVEPMVKSLRECSASGVFVVLNTQDLSSAYEAGEFGRKPGVYIRDNDPSGAPSARNEDLVFERASTEVVQSFSITTDNDWKPMYDFSERIRDDEYDFLYLPFQTAFQTEGVKNASDYAFWSVAPLIGVGEERRCMTYSIPLVLADGMVYGIVGIDLAADYLKSLLPYGELISEDDGAYMLARFDGAAYEQLEGSQTLQTYPVVINGFRTIDNTEYGRVFSVDRGDESEYSTHTTGGQYYVSLVPFRLHNTNTPFEHQRWALMGIVPQTTLHLFADQVVMWIGMATFFMLILGFIGSILLGRSISKPIRDLSREVVKAEAQSTEIIKLPSTGISEVDQLTTAIASLSVDVASARRLEQERLEYERDFDLLTGLMNRRAFYRRSDAIFADPDVLKHAAIVMLDLDNLKPLNDAYGHDCGDKYIYQAARCFEDSVPSNVLVARVSGDEFFLLFYGYDSREHIEADIEKLRVAIPSTEFTLPDGKTTYINASGGVALYLEDSNEFAELMKLADFTMYQVKETGKNNIAYFDWDTYQQRTSVLHAAAELNELLNDFSLASYAFQPIFSAATGEVFAYEALLRVTLDNLKSPADVLVLARQEKRTEEIERLTWTRALECYRNLRSHSKAEEQAYVFLNSYANLSLDEEELAHIADTYSDIMGNVVIEITETEDMDEQATALKRAIPGFSGYFALDDYGSGYNSELMLLTLRPKFVKVDISIIRNINTSADKQRIVSHAVEYAHERDMMIIAEGVETADELDTLLDLGVDLLQGYYLAKPAEIPNGIAAEAIDRIAAHTG